MPSKLNKLASKEYEDLFRDVPSAIFVDFTGVGSAETYKLRKAFHENHMHLRVVKTSLFKVALDSLGTEVEEGVLDGPLGVAFGEDPVAVAKAILEHRRSFRRTPLKVKGGFLEGKPITTADVTNLSNLPDRQQLLGLVAGTIAAPLTSFIGVQAEMIRKLLYAFEALKDKREKAA